MSKYKVILVDADVLSHFIAANKILHRRDGHSAHRHAQRSVHGNRLQRVHPCRFSHQRCPLPRERYPRVSDRQGFGGVLGNIV